MSTTKQKPIANKKAAKKRLFIKHPNYDYLLPTIRKE
jgi:hypothetical protein